LEFTAVGVCIAHRLQIPAHRITHQSHPLSATRGALLRPFHADPPLCGCLTVWARCAVVIPSHGGVDRSQPARWVRVGGYELVLLRCCEVSGAALAGGRVHSGSRRLSRWWCRSRCSARAPWGSFMGS
jgi:hypothetical protein